MALLVSDEEVRDMIPMGDAIEAMRQSYEAFGSERIQEAARTNLPIPTGFLRIMAASWPDRGLAGYKEFHRCNGHVRYTYNLFELDQGEVVAIIDANHLTALRTGACGGLAVDLLAPPGASVLAVIGSGAEARSQIAAIRCVRPITEVRVFSRSAERRARLATELRGDGLSAHAVDDPRTALEGAHIVAVATNTGSSGPAFSGAWLTEAGTHVNSIGSTMPAQRELDTETWARIDSVVIDAELLLEESGDALAAAAAGSMDLARVRLLGDVVSGRAGGRVSPSDRTLYKSVGSGLQDLGLAVRCAEIALASGSVFAEAPAFHRVSIMEG